MGTTALHSLPYPDETAANDYPLHMQNLAAAVDTALPATYPPSALPGLATYEETLFTIATAGTAQALDLSVARNYRITASAASCAITFTNVPATTGRRISVTFALKQDATGGRAWTFPAGWDWGVAGAPVWSNAGLTDYVSAVTDDNGAHWAAFLDGAGFAF